MTETPHTRIFLAGFMGVGKSTIGPLLASRLDVRFVDLDDEIEAAAHAPVTEIFRRYGQEGFRSRETAALKRLIHEEKGIVAALGGGAFTVPVNRSIISGSGISIWLVVPPEVLAERLEPHSADRPVLHDRDGNPLSGSALSERIQVLLEARTPSYSLADIHYRPSAGESPEETADALERMLRQPGGTK